LLEPCSAAVEWLRDQQNGNLPRPDVEVFALDKAATVLWSLLFDSSLVGGATFVSPSLLKSDGTLGLALDLVFVAQQVTRQSGLGGLGAFKGLAASVPRA
jgi:hypothetical protein